MINKLADYEDAEEQGLLLRLPCKVGDTVYWVNNHYRTSYKYRVTEETIKEFRFNGKEITIWMSYLSSKCGVFRKDVFLIKEEAEAKLKEMECKDERN